MADGEVGHVLTQKIGPLPLVLWVVAGSGVVLLFVLMRNKSNAGAQGVQTNQVSALAPTEAEAFGTIEQQQQDVTNALTTLGNNQSALGGSMSTLTGIVTQQGADNAASFQNLQDGQNTIEQGQTAQNTAMANYFGTLGTNLANYYNSLGSQIDGVNSNIAGVNTNLNQGFNDVMLQNQSNVDRQFADFTFLEAGPSDPRIGQWINLASTLKQTLNANLAAQGRPQVA